MTDLLHALIIDTQWYYYSKVAVTDLEAMRIHFEGKSKKNVYLV